ncbi:MAG TPA: hypothetical protein VH370_07895 [Humisphaera sp.]|jgi:hypothetical protein|nr:hypothetical protein [Humisphaera sp.]
MPFIAAIQRILNCAKAQAAATGLASTWLAVRYAAADLPPTQRAALWVAFIGAVAITLREVINAWAEEDVARLSVVSGPLPVVGSGPPSAQQLTTDNGPLTNTTINPQPTTLNIPRILPMRTKLPLILIAFTTIALLSGCQASPPELAIYRDGLHAVDEPLYQAHLLLLDDAVKTGLRSDADRQVIQQGVAAARALYQQAAATQPALP